MKRFEIYLDSEDEKTDQNQVFDVITFQEQIPSEMAIMEKMPMEV